MITVTVINQDLPHAVNIVETIAELERQIGCCLSAATAVMEKDAARIAELEAELSHTKVALGLSEQLCIDAEADRDWLAEQMAGENHCFSDIDCWISAAAAQREQRENALSRNNDMPSAEMEAQNGE